MAQSRSEAIAAALSPFSRWEGKVNSRLVDQLAQRRMDGWVRSMAEKGLGIELDRGVSRMTIQLRGRLDQQSVPALKTGLQDVLTTNSCNVDLDLSEVDKVDGLGLAALVWMWRLICECGGELRIVGLKPWLRDLVAKMNLHHLFEIVEDDERPARAI